MGSIKSIKHKRADELSNEASNFQCKFSVFVQRKKKKVQRYFWAITCFTFIVWKLPLWKAIAKKEETKQQQPAFLCHSDQIHINTEEKIPFSTTLSFWIIWKRNWEFKNEKKKNSNRWCLNHLLVNGIMVFNSLLSNGSHCNSKTCKCYIRQEKKKGIHRSKIQHSKRHLIK